MKIKLPKVDFDERWKQVIGQLAFPFVKYVLPLLYEKLDKAKPIISLDKEFGTIFPDYGKKGKIYPDKLLYAQLKGGKATRIFVHVEVQGDAGDEFTKRVFDYLHPIRNKYPNTDFTVVVIYIGQQIPKNPSVYIYEYHGTEVTYKFNTIIVKELEESELLASENPFALALLASLYSLKTNQGTKNAIQQRLFFKKKLARLCFEKGHLKEYIVNLLNFVAFAVSLPKFEESEFKFEVHNLLNHNKMTLAESNPIATDVMFLVMFGMEYQPYIDKKLSEEFAKKAEESERQIEQIKAQAAVAAKEAEAAKTKAVKEAETVKAKAMKAAEAAKAKAETAKAKAAKAAEKVKIKANKEMELAQNIKRNSVNTLFKFGLSEKEIAKELGITVKSVKEILANRK